MRTEIEIYDPCIEAVQFRSQFNTFKEAWDACHRGDWMLWIAKKVEVDTRMLILAKGRCVETVKHLMKDEGSKKAVEVAIAFGEGEASEQELQTACDAAATAYAAAYADAYYAATCDFTAAYNAAYNAATALKENQMKTANICREILTEEVLKRIENLKTNNKTIKQ